ncbi:hypothetical protein LTR99_005457 [Exophiala xenobiotica]|uniref:Uncharacterized protein n=1 Tax=Vermiconidia calcicola TaxID=1690605 RepID=A0AAV9Q9Q4_9PEZI|nr:hypothetical protein LTR92_004212 [Exophiala xenobiotica]KAK5535783.1 hypothetical protein LTR25_005685 [Vermiconidia calcicola]KAK5548723.1 hypothetical protein LTR23_001212 [Chaetothyriales sp. CCFEE 6169]KAK5258565.1 hypothetical protein LTR40_007657 [Exophiala xenobiotica]KAK5271017.1 hypothetical protein LTR96_004295 [Exophiala xenobiotica]
MQTQPHAGNSTRLSTELNRSAYLRMHHDPEGVSDIDTIKELILLIVPIMPYTLKGRRVLVAAGSRGLGAMICEKFAGEGCHIMVNYVSREDRAKEVVEKVRSFGVQAFMIKGDAGIAEDNVRMVKETVEKLGGLDIIIANAGWTRFSDFKDLHALSHDDWNKCWAVNVMSHLQLMQVAAPIFNANAEGGVYLVTSSIAGSTQTGSSMAYSTTKAAGLHLMKCLAATQGPKIRVNAILPGQLLTDWGMQFSDEQIEAEKRQAVLRHEVTAGPVDLESLQLIVPVVQTFLDDCADAYVSAAKNTSMTGQEITVDAGLTSAWSAGQ